MGATYLPLDHTCIISPMLMVSAPGTYTHTHTQPNTRPALSGASLHMWLACLYAVYRAPALLPEGLATVRLW